MKFYTSVERIGANIHCRGYEDGVQFFEKEEYKPTIYLPSQQTNTRFKTIEGLPVEEFHPGDMYEANDYIKRYGEIANFTYYGMTNWVYNFIAHRFPGTIQYDFSFLRVGFLDLEWGMTEDGRYAKADLADGPITVMTLYFDEVYHVFGVKDFTSDRSDVKYHQFPDEEHMLLGFLDFWESIRLDIVSGWYSEGADIPYLVNRIKRIVGNNMENKLSPFGKVVPDEILVSKTKRIKTYQILGINHIDLMAAYKKFTLSQRENYKLNTIAYVELGEKKLDYSEYGNLQELYEKDFTKYTNYNILDVGLLVRLELKKRLIELVANLAWTAKVNMIDAFKQTRMWDSLIYNHLLEKNIVIPQRKPTGVSLEDDGQFEGAYVKDCVPGMYDWVVSFDFTSLYPSLIIALNISPDTFVGKLEVDLEELIAGKKNSAIEFVHEKNYSLAANGTYYKKDFRGFFAELMVNAFDDRKKYKKEMLALESQLEKTRNSLSKEQITQLENEISKYDVLQSIKKVTANSGYGASGNAGFRFYNKEMAEAITISGQLAIRWMERKFNEYFNRLFETKDIDYLVASDTDSVTGDSEITFANGRKQTIEDFFNDMEKKYGKMIRANGSEIIRLTGSEECAASLSNKFEIQEKKINYVFKHTVKKEFFEISVKDHKVVVTEDHSIIVERDGKLISVKPKEILTTDAIVEIIE